MRCFCVWRAPNGRVGDSPDAVRDQAMRHDQRWTTFFSAYLNRAVEWALVSGSRTNRIRSSRKWTFGATPALPRTWCLARTVWQNCKVVRQVVNARTAFERAHDIQATHLRVQYTGQAWSGCLNREISYHGVDRLTSQTLNVGLLAPNDTTQVLHNLRGFRLHSHTSQGRSLL